MEKIGVEFPKPEREGKEVLKMPLALYTTFLCDLYGLCGTCHILFHLVRITE